jgi:hypothetical protein
MARPFTLKVNRHVSYRRADGRFRSATITSTTDSTHPNVRVGHAGETYTNVPRKAAQNDTGVWKPH